MAVAGSQPLTRAQRPPVQRVVVQSAPVAQTLPTAQSLHAGPPQSTSVSMPPLKPSLHVESHVKVPGSHIPPAQSLLAAHVFPGPHFCGHGPPQSTSVSPPFFTASLHAGAWHWPPAHEPLTQSAPTTQPS